MVEFVEWFDGHVDGQWVKQGMTRTVRALNDFHDDEGFDGAHF